MFGFDAFLFLTSPCAVLLCTVVEPPSALVKVAIGTGLVTILVVMVCKLYASAIFRIVLRPQRARRTANAPRIGELGWG